MVSQYPYTLLVLKVPNLASKNITHRDENGDWVAGVNEGANCDYYTLSACRNDESKSGKDNLTYVIDNTKYVYEALIFAPKSCPKLPLGSKIRVVQSDGVLRTEGFVKKFDKGQMHVRIWV